MSNTITRTDTSTFTIQDAKYLASRISADLNLVRLYYGQITEQQVMNFAIEAAILLKYGLLNSVKYGYKRDGLWVYLLSYSVNTWGGIELADDTPGGIDSSVDITGASWYSFLTRNPTPSNLTAVELAGIEALLPIKRTNGVEPITLGGSWDGDKTYYRNGIGMTRGQFRI